MRTIRIVTTVALMVTVACGLTHATEYFIGPDGDDEAAGSREAPWRSIERANDALRPGDTAVFLPGEYAGTISPANNGLAGAPIAYRSAEPRAARLIPDDGEIISLDGHEHITIADFHIDGQMRANWGQVTDSDHITISGCEMRNGPRTMVFRGCTHLRLIDNHLSADRMRGDMVHVLQSSEVLIEGNSITRVGHCPLRIANCFHVVVRANVFRAEWGRNYEFWHNGRLLIEDNIITRARDSAGSADSRAKNLYDDSIFRRNLVFDNLHTPMNSGSYLGRRAGATQHGWGAFVAVNSRFYHNTIADNLGHGWEIGGVNVSSNVFKNNIFHRNDYAGIGTQVVRADGLNRSNRFMTNILSGAAPGAPTVRFAGDFWTTDEANENTRLGTGGFWSEFHGNIDADPGFVDAANRDYRLSSESAAIDAGTPLTWALGEGTGRELPVTDGTWFYDGFGIEGEEGDFISVGHGDNIAQIQRIEPQPYQPTILHLDREVTWEDAMPVSLPWAGEAPDIGAIQHGAAHPTAVVALANPAAVEPGEPVSFSLDTFGREVVAVRWDFDDGTVSDEMEPTHAFEESGHYGVTVRATFADGRRGVAPVFVHVPQRLDPQAPLVEVDFEDETRGDTWGYHFKFYRGHQTEASHVERPDGEGKCMHIYYNDDKANRTAGQIAPGAWDIDRYPLVRFDYRIPEGVPVAVEVTPFPGPDRPRGFILGGTENRVTRNEVLDLYELVDDGQWHTVTLDVRDVREAYPELQYLRQFMFYTSWSDDAGQEFWFDNFAILPEE